MKSNVPGFLAIIAGVIAIIAGAVGSAGFYGVIFAVAADLAPASAVILGWVLAILDFLASLGGITVIIGGIFILAYKIGLGKFLIGIGIGMSLIGIIISIAIAAIGGAAIVAILGLVAVIITLKGIAIVLSIIARQLTRKVE
ncbi:MAG: hypothetical protein ACFFCD_08360 [Promethearchaeota archaeon]